MFRALGLHPTCSETIRFSLTLRSLSPSEENFKRAAAKDGISDKLVPLHFLEEEFQTTLQISCFPVHFLEEEFHTTLKVSCFPQTSGRKNSRPHPGSVVSRKLLGGRTPDHTPDQMFPLQFLEEDLRTTIPANRRKSFLARQSLNTNLTHFQSPSNKRRINTCTRRCIINTHSHTSRTRLTHLPLAPNEQHKNLHASRTTKHQHSPRRLQNTPDASVSSLHTVEFAFPVNGLIRSFRMR